MTVDISLLSWNRENQEDSRIRNKELFARQKWLREFERVQVEILSRNRSTPQRGAAPLSDKDAVSEIGKKDNAGLKQSAVESDASAGKSTIMPAASTAGTVCRQISLETALKGNYSKVSGAAIAYVGSMCESLSVYDGETDSRGYVVVKGSSGQPSPWTKENTHVQMSKDGAIVWLRKADFIFETENQLSDELKRYLKDFGLNLVRAYLNGRLIYSSSADQSASEVYGL